MTVNPDHLHGLKWLRARRAMPSARLRIALYARTATADFRVPDADIARLRALVERHAPVHRALEITGHPEIASTGLGQPGPVLARLLDDARLARLDVVVVPSLAHLAPTTRRRAAVVESFGVIGVHVVCAAQVTRWPHRAGAAA